MTRDFRWTLSTIAHLPAAACTISAPGSESPPGRGGGAEHRVGRVLSGFAVVGERLCELLQFQTPQVSRREENPALVTITPRSGSGAATPVPNTSLNLLRASAAAESGGGNGTEDAEDNEPRSSTSRARSSTRDAQKSEMELLMEGDALRAAGFARIAKTTRVKAEKALKGGGIVNLAKTTLLRIKYGILLLIKFLSRYSPMQLSFGTLIAYYMVWPNLKPKLREILKKLYSHALVAGFTMRNALLTTISERATGAIVTGALVGITAAAQSVNGATASALRTLQTNESSDEDPDPSAVPAATSAGAGAESVAATDSRSSTPLSPIPESPAARRTEKVVITDIGTGTDRDGKNSGSFVETRVNEIEKSELIASDVSADAIPGSEMTNQSEPTGLNVDDGLVSFGADTSE